MGGFTQNAALNKHCCIANLAWVHRSLNRSRSFPPTLALPTCLSSASVTVWMVFKFHISPTSVSVCLQFQPRQCQARPGSQAIRCDAELSLFAVYLWRGRAWICPAYFPIWCFLPKYSWPNFHLSGSAHTNPESFSTWPSWHLLPVFRLVLKPHICHPCNESLGSCPKHPGYSRTPNYTILLQFK